MTAITLERSYRGIRHVHLFGIFIVLAALGLAYQGVSQSFRPYTTTISEATRVQHGVHLAGYLGSTGAYDASGNFTFLLEDESGALLKVVSAEPRPSNFEHAVSVVAIGHYDAAQQVFLAEELLVKCPSKYQELQTTGG